MNFAESATVLAVGTAALDVHIMHVNPPYFTQFTGKLHVRNE